MKYHILYNPLSDNGHGLENSKAAENKLIGNDITKLDITTIDAKDYVLTKTGPDDVILICGGDGTLNRFVNDLEGCDLDRRIDFYSAGTGNDFLHDLGFAKGEIAENINIFLTNLPKVTVKGKTYRFFNGVGYGIDGYCCEVGDVMRQAGNTKINYAGIAIKGLLFHFKPANATVTIDGKTTDYKKVWLAPTMKGRYYGGGMMPVPTQTRSAEDGLVSILVWHGSGKIRTLSIFPGIFKGEHIKHTKYCESFSGKEISVRFDRPCALQIDGETITDVEEYTVTAG